MKITQVKAYKCYVKLANPLSISFHTFYYSENYYVQLFADNGLTGIGEGAPFESITGDSELSIKDELKSLDISKLPDLCEVNSFWRELKFEIGSTTLKAALDMAIYDLVGKDRSLPVWKLLSNRRKSVPNSVTIFICNDLESTAQEVARVYSRYPDLKVLKIKLKGVGDFERCKVIKSSSPSTMRYVLDANQAFCDPKLGVSELSKIINCLGNVDIVEQPCQKQDFASAAYFTTNLPEVCVVADESCCGISDLQRIISTKSFGGINIKLQKSGGITTALKLASLADSHGLHVMVGQMFESSCSTLAAAHFASAAPGVILTDLDMDLELSKAGIGQARFANGTRIATEVSGLGYTLDFEAINKLRCEGQVIFEAWR